MTALPSFPLTRHRSLLRDAAAGITQQMYFWGCDVRYPEGNLLTRLGFERIARSHSHGEGSSRYRIRWQDGVIELHSFCVGWYSSRPTVHGAVYVRSQRRFRACEAGGPLTPGRYEADRLPSDSSDALLGNVRPLIAWVIRHEEEIEHLTGKAYRQKCWEHLAANTTVRPWLPPAQARQWFRDFMDRPALTPRARDLLRPSSQPTPLFS